MVLYIEDNLTNMRLVEQIFRLRQNVKFLHASTAEIGIQMALHEKPKLILMDINLQGMDGFAALRALKAMPETAHIPVVAVTANAMKEDQSKGISAGFSDYITKPIDVTEFLKTVDRFLLINYPSM
ncbi:response regulator [Methylotenera sp.]|uniref:response regulator n=1 Tax=Methylotenera sp. TaxID=2051956 RepID=UPI0024882DF9|nr:response regulator [Methylotenera sp.]MDI1360857.1 response regulator [Methylotenera sp.]